MVKISGVSDGDLIILSLIQDFSYAWVLVEEYTSVMQVNFLALIVFVKFN